LVAVVMEDKDMWVESYGLQVEGCVRGAVGGRLCVGLHLFHGQRQRHEEVRGHPLTHTHSHTHAHTNKTSTDKHTHTHTHTHTDLLHEERNK
jgi:hypothetical protein